MENINAKEYIYYKHVYTNIIYALSEEDVEKCIEKRLMKALPGNNIVKGILVNVDDERGLMSLSQTIDELNYEDLTGFLFKR
jgi:hypothetical protein